MADRYGLEIRGLAETDATGVGELLARCGVIAAAGDLAARLARLRGAPGAALGAFAWGPPSGLVTANWAPVLLADGPQARIDLLVVDPDERRRGVGRLLLKAAAQAARAAGCRELRIEAPDDRPDLLAFCRASGFTPAGAALARPLRKGG